MDTFTCTLSLTVRVCVRAVLLMVLLLRLGDPLIVDRKEECGAGDLVPDTDSEAGEGGRNRALVVFVRWRVVLW